MIEDPTERPDERTGTWSEHAFAALRRDILSGRLKPGTRLRIEQLRDHYRVGSTPLREALSRLSSEGLVTIEQLKGFRVATVSRRELEELCELRVLIEGEALRRSTRFGDAAWEGQVVAAFYHLDRVEQRIGRGEPPASDEWENRNRDFHHALVAGANSSWLLRLHGQLFDQLERYRRYGRSRLVDTPSRDPAAEHRRMMEAALERRGDDLATLMSAHVMGVLELLRDGFQGPEAGRRARSPGTGNMSTTPMLDDVPQLTTAADA